MLVNLSFLSVLSRKQSWNSTNYYGNLSKLNATNITNYFYVVPKLFLTVWGVYFHICSYMFVGQTSPPLPKLQSDLLPKLPSKSVSAVWKWGRESQNKQTNKKQVISYNVLFFWSNRENVQVPTIVLSEGQLAWSRTPGLSHECGTPSVWNSPACSPECK